MILQHLTMHLGEEKCKVEEYLCEQLRGSQFRSNGPILGLEMTSSWGRAPQHSKNTPS